MHSERLFSSATGRKERGLERAQAPLAHARVRIARAVQVALQDMEGAWRGVAEGTSLERLSGEVEEPTAPDC